MFVKRPRLLGHQYSVGIVSSSRISGSIKYRNKNKNIQVRQKYEYIDKSDPDTNDPCGLTEICQVCRTPHNAINYEQMGKSDLIHTAKSQNHMAYCEIEGLIHNAICFCF